MNILSSRRFTWTAILLSFTLGVLVTVIFGLLSFGNVNAETDATIRENLSFIQAQASMRYAGSNSGYGVLTDSCDPIPGTLWADPTIASAIRRLHGMPINPMLVCKSSSSAYAIEARLTGNSVWYWCVDSGGDAHTSSTQLSATTCP